MAILAKKHCLILLKMDMPENLGGEFSRGMAVLRQAKGQGYSVKKQLEIICSALEKAWKIPAADMDLPSGRDSVTWFREFIGETWERLNHPCSQQVIKQAFAYLQSREDSMNPADFVLLHGDAHGGNTLITLSGDDYKFIDPDGIFYEKAYDLGVLMREWVEDYQEDPLTSGKQRCEYLHQLTGVPSQAIWEWGYLQTVSTAFVLLQIGQQETGQQILRVAECWSNAAL